MSWGTHLYSADVAKFLIEHATLQILILITYYFTQLIFKLYGRTVAQFTEIRRKTHTAVANSTLYEQFTLH